LHERHRQNHEVGRAKSWKEKAEAGVVLCKDISQHLVSDVDSEAFGRSSGELGKRVLAIV
jgi:hypothetical protein